MPSDADPEGTTVLESETAPDDSREYDFAMTARAVVTGPEGPLRIVRGYYALPRHNDVSQPGAADSNDELLARADELYAHSKYYDMSRGQDYFLDRHETWRPSDPAVLSEESAFYEACTDHHQADVESEYAAAVAERRRKSGR